MEAKIPDKFSDFIRQGSEIAGAAIGGALGFLASGPIGGAAVASGSILITKVFYKIGSDIHDRFLGPRERVRVGATATFAIERIKQRLDQGEVPRSDNFFKEGPNKRSSADEVLEGALLKSKSAYEEKKLKYIGRFFANIAFNSRISASRANYYLNLVERLTYRQLCFLSIFYEVKKHQLRENDLKNQRVPPEVWGILQEVNELNDLSLIRQLTSQGERDLFWGLGAIMPARMVLTRLGIDLIKNFDLKEIPEEELNGVAKLLR